MKTICETYQTEIRESCDVLVCGGGFAGIAAALAAARNGATVTLLEREYMLGGLGTAGLIAIYLPLCDGLGTQVSFGIAEELLLLSAQHRNMDKESYHPWLDHGTHDEKTKQRYQYTYNPQLFAILAEQLLIKNGVKILYGTLACAVSKSGKRIHAVIVENKRGRYAIEIRRSIVDCTGDADICKLSGAKTVNFSQGNLLAAWYYAVEKGAYKMKMLGFADIPDKQKTKEVEALVKQRFLGLDGDELSQMMILSHSKSYEDVLAHKKTDQSYELATIATIPQVRMTRRICGVYTMDDDEIKKSFVDSVGLFSDWRKKGPVYELPFSVLHGNDVENLICAGRCISVTDAMWDITRVIPVCAVSGQAAGTAAALTDNFLTVDIQLVQGKLLESGVKIRHIS